MRLPDESLIILTPDSFPFTLITHAHTVKCLDADWQTPQSRQHLSNKRLSHAVKVNTQIRTAIENLCPLACCRYRGSSSTEKENLRRSETKHKQKACTMESDGRGGKIINRNVKEKEKVEGVRDLFCYPDLPV